MEMVMRLIYAFWLISIISLQAADRQLQLLWRPWKRSDRRWPPQKLSRWELFWSCYKHHPVRDHDPQSPLGCWAPCLVLAPVMFSSQCQVQHLKLAHRLFVQALRLLSKWLKPSSTEVHVDINEKSIFGYAPICDTTWIANNLRK